MSIKANRVEAPLVTQQVTTRSGHVICPPIRRMFHTLHFKHTNLNINLNSNLNNILYTYLDNPIYSNLDNTLFSYLDIFYSTHLIII